VTTGDGSDGVAGRDIDPDTAAFLERMVRDAAGAPADPTLAQRREGLKAAVAAYGPDPVSVAGIEDRHIKGPDGPVAIRIYQPPRPEGSKARVPLLLHIHGGGWALGDPDGYAPVVRNYCVAGGCVVVDVDYRRAPEHKHPAALRDCLAALAWARRNARKLGADASRIVVTGDSAGGYLAAGVCQQTPVPVALQVLVYPVTSASRKTNFVSRRELGDGRYFLREFDILRAEREYFRTGQNRERAPASPLLASARVLRGQPRTLVVTATLDPLKDEGNAYAAALIAAGVDCELMQVEGTIHGFVLFAGQIAAGRALITEIGRQIRSLEPVTRHPLRQFWLGG
tara:strand:- start:787 stop:1809 length:1023 start_codon:yes stop_codon:yes gene_type:complete